MVLSLATLAETARQELARNPGKSTVESLVNEAGEAWVNAHSWLYLRSRRYEINLVVGTEDYRLPRGILSVGNVLHRPDSVWCPINVVDYSSFIEERERYLSAVGRTFDPFATHRWDTREGDDEPRMYLSVYPSTLTERVVVEYLAGWLPLDEPADAADIPPPLAQPFKEWVRRYAKGREKQPDFSIDRAMVDFLRGPMGASAKTADGQSSGRIAPAMGAAGDRYFRTKASRYGSGGGTFWDRYRFYGDRT